MNRTRVMLLIAFVAAFAAGGVAGTLTYRPADEDRGRRSLRHELNLTDEQATRVREIWAEAHRKMRSFGAGRRALRQEREAALLELLTSEQREAYEQIQEAFAQRQRERDQQRREIFEQAREATASILTEPQRRKLEQMMERRRQMHRDRDSREPADDAPREESSRERSAE